jgi:hypothetical protein
MYRFDRVIDVLNVKWPVKTRDDALSSFEQSARRGQTPGRTPAPVDVIFPDIGMRLRHVPGEVDLQECRTIAPQVVPGDALVREIEAGRSGAQSRLTILKAVPLGEPGEIRPCPSCGNAMIASALDCALGENAELVVERVGGHWCWPCCGGLICGDRAELRQRLGRWHCGRRSRAVPSFAYDTAAHPRSIQLEVTTRCNLKCGYCSNRLLTNRQDSDFDQLLSLFDRIDFSVVDQVELTGLGETLLHPRLPDILNEIRRRGAVPAFAFLVYMLSPLPRRSGWAYCFAHSPNRVSLWLSTQKVGRPAP